MKIQAPFQVKNYRNTKGWSFFWVVCFCGHTWGYPSYFKVPRIKLLGGKP